MAGFSPWANMGTPGISYLQNFPLQQASPVLIGTLTATGSTAASAANNPFGSSLSLQRLMLNQSMALTEVDLVFGVNFPATNQGQGSISQSFLVYSFGNSTSLASVLSASRAVTWATGTTTSGTSSSLQQGWSGPNIQPFTFAATTLNPGEYAFGHLLSWAAASTSWTVSVYGLNALSSQTVSAVTNLATASLAAASSFATGSTTATAFSATPTSSPVFLTATGTSVALAGGSVHTASGSAAITAFAGAPATLPALVASTGTTAALIAISGRSASTTTALTAFTATPTAASVMSSTGLLAASAHTGSTGTAATLWTAGQSALNLSGVGSTAALSTTNVSTFTAGSLVLKATATVASVVSLLMNTGLAAFGVMSSGGLLAGSFFTASGSNNVLSNAGTAAVSVLSSGGFLAGSFLTASGVANAYTGGTGASSFLSTNGLSAGSFFTASGVASVLSNSGTAGMALAQSFTTNSIAALTAAATATGTITAATSGLPNVGYNGSIAMTTATSQAVWKGGQFTAGIFLSGSGADSIDVRSTAMIQTGSAALIQPWFALVGA